MNPLKTLSLLLSLGLMSACAHLGTPPADPDAPELTAVEEDDSPEYRDFNLEDDTLYDLLVAEIAAQRGQLNITLLNYIQQARHTRDPGVIKRAINAAQFSKDLVAIKELGLLWVEVEPENPSAHQLLAYQYSVEKSYDQAIHHIDKVIELGGKVSIEGLAIGSQSLPEEDKRKLLALYEKLYGKYPDSNAIAYSLAIVHGNLKEYEAALGYLEACIDRDPNFQPAYALKSNILFELNDKEAAMDFTEDAYERFPRNHTIGRLYAGLLIDEKRLDEAEAVFANLIVLYPQSPTFKLSHALVMLENNKTDEAKLALETLLELGVHTNEAHFYLGRIADQGDDPETAIGHYLLINGGMHYDASLERALYLMMKDDRFDDAVDTLSALRESKPAQASNLWNLQFKLLNGFDQKERALATLNEALEEFPESEALLYARAMLRDSEGDMTGMEEDLKEILRINPENAIALNALGYTLADKTDRLEEALQLISLALQLKPENPAIMDSMGWVLYRLGKREEALVFLLNAFQRFSDGEVGAHLGEVLLSLGQKTEAYEVWAKSLELNPEHPILTKTLERLAPELLAPSTNQEGDDTSAPDTRPPDNNPEADAADTPTDESLAEEAPLTQ